MTSASPSLPDFEPHRSYLRTPVGEKRSGAVRYAAAMSLYNMGVISVEMLEIYRRCSKFDREDPIDLALFEGVPVPSFAAMCNAGRSA